MLACAGYLLTMLADSIISHVYSKDVVSQVNGDDVELQGGVLQGKRSHGNISHSHFQMHNGTDGASAKPTLSTAGSLGDSILLIFALCFHSVFEGIAIGVAETEADAWRALWTITLHKIFAAIAMDRPFVSCVAYAFAFAISSPIGVAIGIIIDAATQGAVADWIFAISMGLACGVFIYVSIKHLSTKGYFPQKPVLVDTPFYKFWPYRWGDLGGRIEALSQAMFRSLIFLSLLLLTAGHSCPAGDAEGPAPGLNSKSLVSVKIGCLVLIFVGTFIGGLSPYFLNWNEGFLVLGTQFASGVFLGTALMHFLIEANDTFVCLGKKEYPLASMLACAGYLLTMLADSIISHVYSKYVGSQDNGDDVELQGVVLQGKRSHSSISQSHFQIHNGTDNAPGKSVLSAASSLGDSLMLVFALCFHSVFEGIAIGVEKTNSDAWKALWTISLHKIFAAIALGIAVLRMIPDRPFVSCVAYAFPFAISSPIGVAIGIIIDATARDSVADWISGISMGVACGVFIYVSIKHLSTKGYFPQKPVSVDTPFYKFLAVSLGIGVISVLMIRDA
uniref:Zinc transporter n=1 Tax=Salix viminalis TaxID=40686 RepID=A0A6N2KIW1_SALVM